MTRRAWFATLFSPFITRFLPKHSLPPQNAAEWDAMYAPPPVLTEMYFTENPLFYHLKPRSLGLTSLVENGGTLPPANHINRMLQMLDLNQRSLELNGGTKIAEAIIYTDEEPWTG